MKQDLEEFDKVQLYENYYWGKEVSNRKKMLLAMYEKPMTRKALREKVEYATQDSIYRSLDSFLERGLVICLNEESKTKRFKLYTLSPLGERVVELIKEEG